MQIDLRTASTAVTALEQAGKLADEAATVKVGRVFGRGRTADVARLLDAAAAQSSSAADTVRGAQLVDQASRLDTITASFRGGADAARDGQRTAAHAVAITAARTELGDLSRQLRDSTTGPFARPDAPAWAAGLAAGALDHDAAVAAAGEVEGLRALRPGVALALVARDEPALTSLEGGALDLRIARLGTDSLAPADARAVLGTLLATPGDLAAASRLRATALLARDDLALEPSMLADARAALAGATTDATGELALGRVRRSIALADPAIAARRVRGLVDAGATPAGASLDDLRDLDAMLALPEQQRPLLPRVDRERLAAALVDGDAAAANEVVRAPLAAIAEWAGVGTPGDATRVLAQLAHGVDAPDDAAWARSVQAALDLPEHLRPASLAPATSARADIDAVATGATRPAPQSPAWNVLDTAWVAGRTVDAAAANARAADLLRDAVPKQLDAPALHELQGLAALPDPLRPPALSARTDLAQVAELRRSGAGINDDWSGWNDLDVARATAIFPTPADAAAAARELLTTTEPDARTGEQWRRLAIAARRSAGHEGRGVDVDAAMLDTVAGLVDGSTSINDDWAGWAKLDAVAGRERFATPAAAGTALDALLARPAHDWTSNDWHRLQELSSLPDGVRPAELTPRTDFAQVGRLLHDGSSVNESWGGWRAVAQLAAARRYPDVASATAAWNETLHTAGAALDGDDFDRLAGAASRLASARAAGEAVDVPDAGVSVDQLLEVAGLLRAKSAVNASWGGWLQLDAAAGLVRFPDRASATSALDGLLATATSAWTADDWDVLQSLSSLPDDRRPVELASRNDFVQVARLLHDGKPVNTTWDGWAAVTAMHGARRFPDVASAEAAWNGIVARGPSAFTADDFDTLAAARARFDLTKASGGVGPDPGVDASQLNQVATLLRTNQPVNQGWPGWGVLAASGAAIRFPTREAATARMLELLDRVNPRQLSAGALDELHAISSLPDDLRPDGLPADLDLASAARVRVDGGTPNAGWPGFFALDEVQSAHGVGDYRAAVTATAWISAHPASAVPAAASDVATARTLLDDASREIDMTLDLSNVDESYRGNRVPKVDFASAAALTSTAAARLRAAQGQVDAAVGADLAPLVQGTVDRLDAQAARLATARDHVTAGALVRTLEDARLYPDGAALGRSRADLGAWRAALDAPAGEAAPDAI